MQRNIWFCVKVTEYLEIDNILEICFWGSKQWFQNDLSFKKMKKSESFFNPQTYKVGWGVGCHPPLRFFFDFFNSIYCQLTSFSVPVCLSLGPILVKFGDSRLLWQPDRRHNSRMRSSHFWIKMRIFTIFRWKNLWNATKSIKMFNCIKCYNSSKQ